MPAPGERAGSIYVYVVSSLLLLAILLGGAFLVLYVALPETPSTAWFPAAGLSLVGAPWLFWVVTYLYRAFTLRKLAQLGGGGGGGDDRAPPPVVAVAMGEDPPVDSPAGGRRVRFGAVTVMGGSSRDASTGGGGGSSVGGSSEMAEVESEEESEGSSHGTPTSVSEDEEGSSLTSPAIELPLFAARRSTGND
ncbi:hypothetical protein Taro_002871 [Colocasia esculenta]|uniref:Uncharacterized protein n=1 Tax=Colocasia esculenta TaxID=4460 RepID=A0A843TQ43_COLES|nr:hypothetical protein [Colocasia esculenta]